MTISRSARKALVTAVNAAVKHVPLHPYVFETDRWLDLLVLLLIDVAGLTKGQAIAIARHLSVTSARRLPNRKVVRASKEAFLATVNSPGFDHDRVGEAVAAIERLSQMIRKRYGGGVHTLLRSYGERMAGELAAMLYRSGVSRRAG